MNHSYLRIGSLTLFLFICVVLYLEVKYTIKVDYSIFKHAAEFTWKKFGKQNGNLISEINTNTNANADSNTNTIIQTLAFDSTEKSYKEKYVNASSHLMEVFVNKKELADNSPYTSYECVEDFPQRTCYYRNIYFHNNNFYFYLPKQQLASFDVTKHHVLSSGKTFPGTPAWHVQAYSDEIPQDNLESRRGLHLFLQLVSAFNVAHWHFDSIICGFAAMCKFGLEIEDWTYILSNDFFDGDRNSKWMKSMKTLSGHDFYFVSDLQIQNRWIHLERFIVGVGWTGFTFPQYDFISYGREGRIWWRLRQRWLTQIAKLKPELNVQPYRYATSIHSTTKKLRAMIVLTKRAIDNVDDIRQMLMNRYPDRIEVNVVRWETVGSFEEQLAIASQHDIFISRAGTGSCYYVFLPPGGVFITMPSDIPPQYIEEFQHGAIDYLRIIYYYVHRIPSPFNPYIHLPSFEYALNQTVSLVGTYEVPFAVPTINNPNMSILGQGCAYIMSKLPEGRELWDAIFSLKNYCMCINHVMLQPDSKMCWSGTVPPEYRISYG